MTALRTQKQCVARALRRLVRLLPARSRERYARELADVYTALLRDAARTGSSFRFWRQAILLLVDVAQSLAREYLDLWRASTFNPHAAGIVLLTASAIAWLLIVLASAADQVWAARLLDASLGLTMAIAFGFPAVAFGLSLIRLMPYVRTSDASQLTCSAGAAAVAAWAVLGVHLGQIAP